MKLLGKEIKLSIGEIKKPTPTNAGRTVSNGKKIDDFKSIVNQLVAQFKDQSRKDIQKWRQSLVMANLPENPRLNFYHDLVDDLLTDGNLQAQIQLRIMSTLNTPFSILHENGKTNDEATDLFNQQWFYDLLNEAIWAILRGTKVIEFHEFNGNQIKLAAIPQRNVVPWLKTVFPDLSKQDGIRYDDTYYDNWLIQIGKDRDLGILNNVIPNLIWIRNVLQAWAEFCERFGLPMIAAYTTKSDTDAIDKIDYMLGRMSMASRGVFPEGVKLEFKEANRTDAYQVFDKFIERNMRIVRQAIVGGTMLTDDGSSRSQSEVHERNLDDKIAVADKRSVEFLVIDKLLPILRNQGYSFIKEGDRFSFNQSHNLELDKFWNITQGIMQDHEVDPEWLSKTFSIPIIGKKKIVEPTIDKKITAYKKPNYIAVCNHSKIPMAANKSNIDITKLTLELIKGLYNKKDLIGTVGEMIVTEALYLLDGLRSSFKTTSAYTGADLLTLQMMEYNIFEFTASKTEARLAAMTDLLIDKKNKQLRNYNDFEGLCLRETKDFDTTWLQTEYNLSVAVGQNSAAYIRFMAEKDTVTSFVQYQTIGDDAVRASHSVLDGKIFNLSDKEAMDLWTPNGYGCRCEFLQYIGETEGLVTTGKRAKELMYNHNPSFKGSQFEINRGDLKQVFTKKQFYADIKGLPEKLNQMTFDKYGLRKWSAFKNDLNTLKLDNSITKENVSELFKKEKGKDYMGFIDYLGRKMTLSKKTFSDHTKGKYVNESEQRHLLFPHINNAIDKPDEVWYYDTNNQGKKFQSRYVKFYKNETLVVDCDVTGDMGLEVKTWYKMKVDDSKIRKGLKIK